MIPTPGSAGSASQQYRKPFGLKSDAQVTNNPTLVPQPVLSSSTTSFTVNTGSFIPNFTTNNTLFSLPSIPGSTTTNTPDVNLNPVIPGFSGFSGNVKTQGTYRPPNNRLPNNVNDVLLGLGATGVGSSVSAIPIFNAGSNNIFGGGNFQSSIFTMPQTLPGTSTQDPLGLNQFTNGFLPTALTGQEGMPIPFTGATGLGPTTLAPNSMNEIVKKFILSLLQKRKSDTQKAEVERRRKAEEEKAQAEQQKADTEKAKAEAEKAKAEAEKAKAEAERARTEASVSTKPVENLFSGFSSGKINTLLETLKEGTEQKPVEPVSIFPPEMRQSMATLVKRIDEEKPI